MKYTHKVKLIRYVDKVMTVKEIATIEIVAALEDDVREIAIHQVSAKDWEEEYVESDLGYFDEDDANEPDLDWVDGYEEVSRD